MSIRTLASDQRSLPIHKHTPPRLTLATLPGDDSIKVALLTRELEHGIVKGARLQPHGGDSDALGLLQDLMLIRPP